MAPPARVRDDGPAWIAVHDSEVFTADAELGRHLADTLGVAVVHVEFDERLDWARVWVYGQGGPKARRSWDAVESFVEENLPYPVGPYPVGYGRVPDERLAEWEIFGFEAIAYRPGTAYRGLSAEEVALDVDKRLAEGLAARADIAGARALLARNPQVRYHLLNALDRNMDDAAARGAYLAFADDILATDAFWMIDTLAKAVVLDGDEALFTRVCSALGDRVARLEVLAATLLTAGRTADAVRLLAAVCAVPQASPAAWNHLATGLCRLPGRLPAQARDWLAGADAHGDANPHLFHNTARAWLRLGDRDRALAAVEAAVRFGYHRLAELRTDDDLAALHGDPRFVAAFTRTRTEDADRAAPPLDLADLTVTTTYNGSTRLLCQLVLTMHLFLKPQPAEQAGPALADLVRAYLDDVPAGSLTHYDANGPWKPLTKAKITRDVNGLRKATNGVSTTLHYRGDADDSGGAPTPYGLDVELYTSAGQSRQVSRPTARLVYPLTDPDPDPDAVVERFLRYAALVPFDAGGCGVELHLRQSSYGETWWQRKLIEDRRTSLLGLEHHPRRHEPGAAPGASWLTLLGTDLLTRLGPAALPTAQSAGALVLHLHDGVCLRASAYPPIGAVGDPRDLGALPTVARTLRPARIEPDAPHYARLDDLPDGAYDNKPAT